MASARSAPRSSIRVSRTSIGRQRACPRRRASVSARLQCARLLEYRSQCVPGLSRQGANWAPRRANGDTDHVQRVLDHHRKRSQTKGHPERVQPLLSGQCAGQVSTTEGFVYLDHQFRHHAGRGRDSASDAVVQRRVDQAVASHQDGELAVRTSADAGCRTSGDSNAWLASLPQLFLLIWLRPSSRETLRQFALRRRGHPPLMSPPTRGATQPWHGRSVAMLVAGWDRRASRS